MYDRDWCEQCGEIPPNGSACTCEYRAEDDSDPPCSNKGGHEWEYSGTAYGGDDESYHGEGRCYCVWCGTDGDA
jgi:hypothetical protein